MYRRAVKKDHARCRRAYRRGLYAEFMAALILRLKGYRILEHRYKTPVGEVDLIARRGAALVFVEVKARSDMPAALESISSRMKSRISRAAQFYISANPALSTLSMRFDVIVYVSPFLWRHLDNAWSVRS